MDIHVDKIDPHEAEGRIEDFGAFSARSVFVDGDEIMVLIYSNGPTPHMNAVERAIDSMSELRSIVLGDATSRSTGDQS